MQLGILVRHVGNLLVIVALTMLVPAAYAWTVSETAARTAFLVSTAVTAGVGLVLRVRVDEEELNVRTAVGVVTIGWATAAVASALPFWLLGAHWADALFEAAAGVTTTGATALNDIESQPHALLLWRSMLQWFGGMGIVVLFVSVFPQLGIGAIQLFRAEVPGPQPEKLLPRLSETSKLLWGIYGALTGLAALLLMLCGLDPFDAINHALTTVSTGGFSTRAAGIATFASPAAEIVVTVFMFLGAMNFMLLYRLLRFGDGPAVRRDEEFRAYVTIALAGGLLIAASLWIGQQVAAGAAVRSGLFQAVSIMTTTGFAVGDYTLWPPLAQAVLFLLMFVGGSAGSTAGGPKVIRILIALKHGLGEMRRLLHPRVVRVVRIGGAPLPATVFAAVTAFLFVYMTTWFVSIVVLGALGVPLADAMVAAISALGNIGPGFGAIGPTETFFDFSPAVKLYLALLMLVGRLEMLSVFVLFQPEFWDRRPKRRV